MLLLDPFLKNGKKDATSYSSSRKGLMNPICSLQQARVSSKVELGYGFNHHQHHHLSVDCWIRNGTETESHRIS